MDETAYNLIARAVYGRWRRRLLYSINLTLFCLAVFSVWLGVRLPRSFDPFSYILGASLVIWLGLMVIHTFYVLYTELRDRALRREIEREYRRRLLENMYSEDDHRRAQAERLAFQHYDGELLDLEEVLADQKAKRKRM